MLYINFKVFRKGDVLYSNYFYVWASMYFNLVVQKPKLGQVGVDGVLDRVIIVSVMIPVILIILTWWQRWDILMVNFNQDQNAFF